MSFEKAYKKTIKHEGGYANIKSDKGGETYKGIARNYHPYWAGWSIIDREKAKKGGTLPHNYIINSEVLNNLVASFYRVNFWERLNLGKIYNETLQDIIFDFAVNSGKRAIVKVQRLLNELFGKNLLTDGILGNKTARAINNCDAEQLFNAIKLMREEYYNKIAQKGNNRKFLNGWLNRLKDFKYEK